MKRRSVGPPLCPAITTDAGESVTHTHMKINNIIDSIFHQFQSRGRVYKRALSYPHNYLKYLSLYGINSSQSDAGPLDLSSKSSRPVPQTSLTKTNKHSSENEIIWKPLRRHSSPQLPVAKTWFPVNKKITSNEKNKPKFFPLTKKGVNNNYHHFPWTNPLNRIFLQEKNSEGEEIGAQEQQTQNKNSDSPNQSSSHTKVGPLPAMKATVANPFKITPSSSWPLENNEQPSKPILAPPKFGANSVFGKYSSTSSATQGKDLKNSTTPTILVPLHEAPKPTFKLKPPVLGNTLSTSPVSSKRPASKLDSTSSSSSSSSSNDDGPDAKRVRVSTAEEIPSVKESPAESSKSPEKDDTNSAAEKKEPCSLSALPSTPEKNVSSSETQKDSPTTAIPTFVPLSNSSNKESPRSEESNSRVNGVGSTPPLSSKVGNAGFIFGQNLENRVSGVSPSSSAIFSNGETNPSSPSSGHNLFTAAANSIAATSAAAEGSKSLSESSRELSMKEESLKTKYEEVQVITGEEGERNVIQMNCKLYGWSSGSWQERGRGILRLNDREIRDELHSRLVIRTQGTLTVMLNAKIWAEMSIEKPNDKSVRFTATDVDGQPKIYLVMGSPKDITLLHNSLEYRVAAARSQTLDEKERESDQDQDTVSQLSV